MRLLTVGALVCVIVSPGPASRPSPLDEGPVDLRPEGAIRKWVVLGPFENPRELGTRDRKSFDTDYLASIGGEANARISADTEVDTTGADGQPLRLTARPIETTGPVLDFAQQYTETDLKLAYAYTKITATRGGEALFLLGSDDGAKVWVNGAQVFEILPPDGRGLTARQDRFTVKLRKGANTVLVKVENGRGAWQLALEAYGTEAARKLEAQMELERRTLEFQDQGLGPAGTWPGYVFLESDGFPRIIWRDVERVRALAGDLPLKVRWYNAQLDEVETPSRPGRYAAVVESKMHDGTPVRRAMTFFAVPDDSGRYWPDYSVPAPYPGRPVDPVV